MQTYDREKLALLVKAAIGARSQATFAKENGITYENLNRICKASYKSTPAFDFLYRIYKGASPTSLVTLSDLLLAAGYIDQPIDIYALPSDEQAKRTLTAIITAFLASHGFTFSLMEDSRFSLRVKITEGSSKFDTWSFFFLPEEAQKNGKSRLVSYYYGLVFMALTPRDKISFVTCDEDSYKNLISEKPRNLSVELSAILADIKGIRVLDEKPLSGI